MFWRSLHTILCEKQHMALPKIDKYEKMPYGRSMSWDTEIPGLNFLMLKKAFKSEMRLRKAEFKNEFSSLSLPKDKYRKATSFSGHRFISGPPVRLLYIIVKAKGLKFMVRNASIKYIEIKIV